MGSYFWSGDRLNQETVFGENMEQVYIGMIEFRDEMPVYDSFLFGMN